MTRSLSLLLLYVLCLVALPSAGQSVSSEIQGTVKDPSGAVIVGTYVTATNLETGVARSTVTDGNGRYHIDGLSAGSYQLRIEHAGFKVKKLTDITLLVNQSAVLDATLEVGATNEEFTIVGETPLVETTTAQMSSVVTATGLSELPLNGRDLFQLTELQTGVVPTTNGGSSLWTEGNMSKASAQGARPTMNNVTLDGGDINDPGYDVAPGGPAGAQLGVEAVREFRVILNTYSAEYGRNGGANVQFVTKSGTNSLHGSVFEFFRNAALDAANYFDTLGKPAYERNQFGATLGGPIVKDHTFFFINYEGLRERKGITTNISAPDDNARIGLLPALNGSGLVNVGVNPTSALFIGLYPRPNGPELVNAGVPSGLALFTGSEVQTVREDYAVLRIDQTIGNKDQIFGRYVFDDGVGIFPFQSTAIPGFPGKRPIRNQYFMLSWQRSITDHLLNEAKFNFNRTRYLAEVDNTYPLSISLVPGRALGVILIGGLPALGNNLVYPLGSTSNTFEGIDNLSWEHERHSLKFGVDAKRIQINGPFDFGTNGEYSFTGSAASTTTNPTFESFLRGIPAFYIGTDPALSNSDRGFRQTYLGLYAQDDWRITPNLTLNLGLRWEYSSIPTEAEGRISNFHDVFTDKAPTVGPLWSSVPLDLWSPRFGFAWSPSRDAKTVVRGGFGIMRDQIWSNLYFDVRFYRPFFGALISESPNFLAPPTSIAALRGSTSPVGVFGITFNPQFPYYEQWSLNIQRQLGRDTVFQIAYVGSHGVHLPRAGEANPYEPTLGHNLNPNFGSTPQIVTDATSSYNSLQVSLQRRFVKGLSFQGSYTYSHSIDNASGAFPSDWVSEPGVSQNFFDLNAERGSSAFDRRNVFIGNLLYDLPFGPGQRWGRGEQGATGKIVGGWRVGIIGQLLSGVPFTPVLGFNNSLTAASFPADRPDIKSGVNPCNAVTGNVNQWFDPSIFTLPNTPDAAGNIFGDAGRNSLCGPSLKEFDFSLIKHAQLSEHVSLEFRSEFFNIFNHPNFAVPDNTQGPNGTGGNGDAIFVGRASGCDPTTNSLGCGILAGNAGRIFSTVTSARQIQFALKLNTLRKKPMTSSDDFTTGFLSSAYRRNPRVEQSQPNQAGSLHVGSDEEHPIVLGEMARLIESFDWSLSPLGPSAQWPQSLKTALNICLRSRFQLAIYWGPELVFLYNDAEREVIGALHPYALGKPAREVLVDMWETVGPMLHKVLKTGEATWSVDQPLMIDRYGVVEEAFFTWSYSPIPDDDGDIGGVLLVTEETTQRVLAEQWLRDSAERERKLRAEADSQRALLETVLNQMAAGVVIAKAPSGEVVLANNQAKQILQRSVGDLRSIEEYSQYPIFRLDGRAYDTQEQPFARSILQGEVVVGEELRYLRPDGTFRVLFTNSAPVRDETGTIVAGVVSFQDITDLRLAQEELLRQSNDVIHDLAGKLITAQEEERRRIARDLHDDVAQRIALLSNKMQILHQSLPTGIAAAEEFSDILKEIEQASENVRVISHQLHSSKLILGLPRALAGYCREFSQQRGINVEFTQKGTVGPLPEPVPLVMFRVLQEALHNVARHSAAAQVEVSLLTEEDEIRLRIKDRGKGFDPVQVSDGLGLVSMRERLRLVGGKIKLSSAPGLGTEIEAAVPITPPHSSVMIPA